MNNEFCEIDGEVISASNLTVPKAKDFANAVENSDYASLVECRRTNSDREIIVFDAKVQVGQKTVHKIKKHERLAVVFEKSDTIMPDVLALRKNFPLVSHVNLRSQEFPRSLCVTEQQYSEAKLRWTGPALVKNTELVVLDLQIFIFLCFLRSNRGFYHLILFSLLHRFYDG